METIVDRTSPLPSNNEFKEKSEVETSNERVVPVDYVEDLINKVIEDLEHVLDNMKETRIVDEDFEEKYVVTKKDLERALNLMKLHFVTEIQ